MRRAHLLRTSSSQVSWPEFVVSVAGRRVACDGQRLRGDVEAGDVGVGLPR